MSNPIMHHLIVGDNNFEIYDAAARAGIGSPLVAATAAAMTDTSKIYVYTGSEFGYIAGNWYYFNGSAWTSGGVYNSAAINVDPTLTVEGEAADAKAAGDAINEVKGELDVKANIDGAYENMTVGNAEQLISTVGENNKTPYNFRTSGGSIDIGDREVDKLVGGTVAWNQLIQTSDLRESQEVVGITATNNNNGSFTLQGTATDNSFIALTYGRNVIENHVYYVGKPNNFVLSDGYSGDGYNIFKYNRSSGNSTIYAYVTENAVINETIFIQKIDLTAMFGSTIADYIYSLEQATAGAGVAWFKKLFPKAYYAYNVGQLMSVKTSSHDMVGFNAYDDNTGTAKLVGGMEYQISGTYTSIEYSTGETLTPDVNGKFTPTDNGVLTVAGGNNTDTCVHLVWDGERDGDYEEYEKYSYALDPDLELRGIPKLVNGKLEYDGDTYESDGTVNRRYGIVDLGTLNWGSGFGGFYTAGLVSMIKLVDSSTMPNMLCVPYETVKYIDKVGTDKTISLIWGSGDNPYNKYINVLDSAYSDAAAFKAAMSGVYLVYEKATPAEESADPFTNPQIVDDFGTEEYAPP